MQIDITFRHFTSSEQLKEMVYKKLKKIEKFNNSIISCHVVFTKEANYECVEIVAHGKGAEFVAHENGDTFEKALITAIDKVTIQIKKKHDRIVSH